jgi:hypothetical protein
MAEKRKPSFVFLLKKYGNDGKLQKTNKVECFPECLFKEKNAGSGFRIRVNGKWFPKDEPGIRFYFKTQIMQLISKSINF